MSNWPYWAAFAVAAVLLIVAAAAVVNERMQARRRQERLDDREAWGEFMDGRWSGARDRGPLRDAALGRVARDIAAVEGPSAREREKFAGAVLAARDVSGEDAAQTGAGL